MPVGYEDLKTVAEQTAFEFGRSVNNQVGETTTRVLANKYAFTHQCSAFPRSDNGYERLRVAFLAGARLNLIV